jgi:hypothetical protein
MLQNINVNTYYSITYVAIAHMRVAAWMMLPELVQAELIGEEATPRREAKAPLGDFLYPGADNSGLKPSVGQRRQTGCEREN